MKFDFTANIRYRWLCMATTALFTPLIYMTLVAVAVLCVTSFNSLQENSMNDITTVISTMMIAIIIGMLICLLLSMIYLPIGIITILALFASHSIVKNKYFQLFIVLIVPFILGYLTFHFHVFGIGQPGENYPLLNVFVGLLATAPMFVSFYVSKSKVEDVKLIDKWE